VQQEQEKTKTLQLFAENLSDKDVPVLLLDIKGDLSGLADEGRSPTIQSLLS
jgi:DNA helicase HerA-like ATPase